MSAVLGRSALAALARASLEAKRAYDACWTLNQSGKTDDELVEMLIDRTRKCQLMLRAEEALGRAVRAEVSATCSAMLLRKINTSYDYPPVPTREFDWSATFDGYEPGDSIGTGSTEQEAIDWLIAEESYLIAHRHDKQQEAA